MNEFRALEISGTRVGWRAGYLIAAPDSIWSISQRKPGPSGACGLTAAEL